MKINTLALAALLTLFSVVGKAQQYGIEEFDVPGKNILKANLTGLLLRNYGFQYERVLTRTVSVAVSYRFMPSGSVPFENVIINNSPDIDPDRIDQMKLSSSAITPEVRFYFGKQRFGRGFYLAPFYRFANHEALDIPIDYKPSAPGSQTVEMLGKGKLTSNTGGILVGAQWNLGRSMVLDWWIVGPHLGNGDGEIIGVSPRPLTGAEQADLKETLETNDLPFGIKSTATVNANGFNVQLNGPMAGLRAGVQIGFRF